MKKIFVLLLFLLSSFSYAGSSSITVHLLGIEKINNKTYILILKKHNSSNCNIFKLTSTYSYKEYALGKIDCMFPNRCYVPFPSHGTFVKNMEKLQKQVGKDIEMELVGSNYWKEISSCHYATKAIAFNGNAIVPMIVQN
jgi:hypothetical protein